MTPRPEDTDSIIAETEVEKNDAVDEVEDTTDPKDAEEKPAIDEVEKTDTTEEAQEEPAAVVEDMKPKTPEEIRQSFDPFFSGDDAADKIAKDSADAAKELASIFS